MEVLVSAAQGMCCPALVAAGWEALCSATLVITTMTVKGGKREGNALNPLKGMNVAGNSLEMNLSESLKCNTLASRKFCQLLREERMVLALQQCPSLHWQKFTVTWSMYFECNCSSIFCVNIRDYRGDRD